MAQARIDGSMKSRSRDEKIREQRGVCVRSAAVNSIRLRSGGVELCHVCPLIHQPSPRSAVRKSFLSATPAALRRLSKWNKKKKKLNNTSLHPSQIPPHPLFETTTSPQSKTVYTAVHFRSACLVFTRELKEFLFSFFFSFLIDEFFSFSFRLVCVHLQSCVWISPLRASLSG